MHTQICTHVASSHTHTTAYTHPWKKPLTLRPHKVHVSPSGIINTMLMNIGLGPGACEEQADSERGKEDRGWEDGGG